VNETRVLLVEDEPGYARFLRAVLCEIEGTVHHVTWVATLAEALAQLGKGAFDIILLDLGLPMPMAPRPSPRCPQPRRQRRSWC